ncbi:hypothetical protein CDD83_1628 [Cordyceps sp. RAO-2017]|nr:hypothetical protein CDD83_1628 [Cordyceps sp. RAO-2017]
MSEIIRRSSRWILERCISALDREEQGFPPQNSNYDAGITDNGTTTPAPPRSLTVVTTDAAALIPSNDKLLIYRSLTGIDTVPALTSAGHAQRAAPNLGIYPRAVNAERSAARSYRFFNVAVNACLGLQIIVAASLTALGAANGSRAAVTGFGAINTIVAGILTYLKGSGLPNRLKYVEDEFKLVREYAEQREREFCLAGCPLDPLHEVQTVEDMYRAAKLQMQNQKTPGAGGGGGGQPPRVSSMALSSLAQRFSRMTDTTHVPPPEKH